MDVGYERFYWIAVHADGTPWSASEFEERRLYFDEATGHFIHHGPTYQNIALPDRQRPLA